MHGYTLRKLFLSTLLTLGFANVGTDLRADFVSLKNVPTTKEIKDSFKSGSATVKVLRFEPNSAGKHPVVIMLHGADGWGQMTGYRFAAQGLNANGQIAILIRYYDRTKTPEHISTDERNEFVRWLKGEANLQKVNMARKHFEEWMETVRDAVAYARSLPNVDPDRVALAGFSLGGFLALSTAPTCEPPVKAVVEMFGGLPEAHRKKLGTMPPTLIVHGEEDTVVSVNEAYKAAGMILAQKQHVVLEVQKGVGHACTRPGTEIPDHIALFKARSYMLNFLKTQLNETPTTSVRK